MTTYDRDGDGTKAAQRRNVQCPTEAPKCHVPTEVVYLPTGTHPSQY